MQQCRLSTHCTDIVFSKFYSNADFPHIGWPLCSSKFQQCRLLTHSTALCSANSLQQCRLSTYWMAIVFSKFYSSAHFPHNYWMATVIQQILVVQTFNTLDCHCVQQILQYCRLSTYWMAIVFSKVYSADFPHIGLPLCSANSMVVQTFHILDGHCVQQILRLSTHWTAIMFSKFSDFPHIGRPLCLANSIVVQTFHTLDCHCVQ